MSDDQINKAIGLRTKMARQAHRKTLKSVADDIGCSYQQVRKYEEGINRISASYLLHLSEILQVPVAYFFELQGTVEDVGPPRPDGELGEALRRIEDDEVRRRLAGLIAALQGPARSEG